VPGVRPLCDLDRLRAVRGKACAALLQHDHILLRALYLLARQRAFVKFLDVVVHHARRLYRIAGCVFLDHF
jgi:hypothetical protein